jgi:Cu/Ag efflux protein CusF
MQRRTLITAAAAALATGLAGTAIAQMRPGKPQVLVWKDPNCGCCNDWIRHLQENGFEVRAFDTGNLAARRRLGMPEQYGSCHTAQVGGYVIEGHVPAPDIHRLLKDKPQALGLSVPRMPIGSPGMDGPEYGGRQDPYDVLLVQRDGSSRVFASYAGSVDAPRAQRSGMLRTSTEAPGGAATDPQGRPWAEAEVRRIDARGKRLSLRHGPIPNLDMPPMTMFFQVSDPAMLDQVKVGDRIRFSADKVNNQYTVMAWQVLP